MKFFGHPIHIMLVHFPIALFPFEFVCSFLGFYTGNRTFTDTSFYAIVGGVILGWAAIGCGIFDLLQVLKDNPKAVKTAVIHGSVNTCVLMVYTVLAYSQYKNYPALKPNDLTILILKAGIIGLMFVGNYFGGSLILKYKIAVEND
ncbi:MAG: DUF2231 domain-containing protein [Actinomycetota bacterium]